MSSAITQDEPPTTVARPVRRRRPLLAFLLSLICPGLGQIYATRVARGTRLLAVLIAITVLSLGVFRLPPVSATLFAVGVSLVAIGAAYHLGVAIDAYRVARRTGTAALTRFNRIWIYFAILLVTIGLPQSLTPLLRWKTYSVSASSMLPGMPGGDYFIAWRGYYADHPPAPGDLVVFKLPRDNRTDYVKRIVGLPGQRIQMRAGRLYIDNQLVPRLDPTPVGYVDATGMVQPGVEYTEALPNGATYRIVERSDNGPLDDTPVYTVPAGHVFVLGDNRDNSLDSRVLDAVGYVPFANLRDRPSVILWSADRDRIGMSLR